MTTDRHERPHSAEFFGPERDYWWSRDHLELIADRLELEAVRSGLDVGCGIGHWARLVGSVMCPEAAVIGVDREAVWVREAAAIAKRTGRDRQFRYEQGTAEALRFADASFDLVTCQTFLIHVPSPRAVIEEMLRVTRPGGLILAAEPNNRASLLVDTSVNAGASIDDLLERMRFLLICERGKEPSARETTRLVTFSPVTSSSKASKASRHSSPIKQLPWFRRIAPRISKPCAPTRSNRQKNRRGAGRARARVATSPRAAEPSRSSKSPGRDDSTKAAWQQQR